MAKILRNIDQIIDTQGNELSVANPVEMPAPVLSFRNKIINGNFDIWQRGTSQTSSGYRSVDRWSLSMSGTTARTGTQQAFTLGQTDVPGNPKYYLSNVVTAGSNATDYANINTRIEGVSTLSGKTATLSFWAKSDANRNIASELFQRFGTGGTPSAGVSEIGITTHSLTTSWQKFTVTTSIPSIIGKTLGTDNNNYLGLVLWFDAGSTYDSRTNSLGNQSGTFDIAQVQLEEGPVATPFEQRPYGLELSLCQRYCEAIDINQMNSVYSSWLGKHYLICEFKTTKRVAPSATSVAITNYQPGGGTGTAVMEGNGLDSARIYTGSTNSTFNLQYINNGHTSENAIMIFDAEL